MELYISTTFAPDESPLYKALDLCKGSDIQAVEIGSNHCYEEDYRYLSNYNFQYLVHNYFPIPQKSFVVNITSFDKEIRTMSIKHIKRAIDFCEKINAKLYTFHPGFLTDPKGSNQTKNNYDFQWDENQLRMTSYSKAKALMFQALDKVVAYAKSKNIKVAIETEGSFNKKGHLLMQQPEEYQQFMANYSRDDIGINLNIGHLNLASNAFNFNRQDFIDLIQKYIVAMELSHNNGVEDQHLPLQPEGWYWDLINNRQFKDTFKVLEFRNTPVLEIVKNIRMIEEKIDALSLS
jgi:sugar phosphate isomerase/epimerase